MELVHEPEPGFKGAFYIAIVIAVVYLGIILYRTMF